MSRKRYGIFCLEGDWWNDFNRGSTVSPILKLVNQAPDKKINFIHRDVATVEEFDHYCSKWTQGRMKKFEILYLAFHGSKEGGIHVGDQRRINRYTKLEDLSGILGSNLGGRIIHFGSCGTLAVDRRRIQRFLRETGLLAVTGYKSEVDWMYSAAFEVLLFDAITRFPFTKNGMVSAAEMMRSEHRKMCKTLDFRMEVNES